VRALSESASQIRTECARIKQSIGEVSRDLKEIIQKNKEFPELSDKNEAVVEMIDTIGKFMGDIDSAGGIEKKIPEDSLKGLLVEAKDFVQSSSKKCDSLFEAEKITEAEKEVLRIVGLIGQVKSIVEEISKTEAEKKLIEERLRVARYVYSEFTLIKKKKVQDVFNVIQGDIEKYYTMLHPDDAHRNIELRLPTSKRASVDLRIESFGRKDEDPRAYGSEGHLDSLGLCIFLALVRRFNNDCSLVVLDDVVTTVDIGHRENICKLLIDEFGDKQLIITTHEGLWYEQLRSHHRAAKVEGNFNYITAIKWEVGSGPTIRPYKQRWERIMEKLDGGDKGAGNEGRTYMEWVLESICNSLEAQVPFRITRQYDVGDLMPSAKKRVGSLIKDEELKEKALKAFEVLEATTIYGNIISHNNPMAEELSIDEVKKFCEAVHKLYCTFLCPNCGQILRLYRDLGIVRCSNKNCDKPFEVKAS